MKHIKNPWVILLIVCSVLIIVLLILRTQDNDGKGEAIEEGLTISFKDVLDTAPNPLENAVMYDFVYSTIGYKSLIDAKDYGNSYLLMINNDAKDNQDSGTIHISQMLPQDFFPPTTTGHLSIRLEGERWHQVLQAMKIWPSNRKFDALTHTLYVMTDENAGAWLNDDNTGGSDLYSFKYSTGAAMWNGINLTAIEYPEGWLLDNLDDNGWATDWLRKEPYRSQILDKYRINVQDEFFDKFNLYKVFKVAGSNGPKDIRLIRVDGVDIFSTLNGPVWHMSLNQMNLQLVEEGYDRIPVE